MEIVNMMFEKYGGSQMGRIFRNYLVLALLIKELMFSLFLMPTYQPEKDLTPENHTPVPCSFRPTGFAAEDLNLLQVVEIILSFNPSEKGTLSQKLSNPKPLQQHETI